MTHSLKTKIFLGGGPNGKVVALGILVICPVDKNRDSKTKLTFGPKYPNFRVKIAYFRPQRPIGAALVNVFNMKKVPHWFPGMRARKVLLHPPPKKWIFGQKTAKFGPKLAFLANYWHFWPI